MADNNAAALPLFYKKPMALDKQAHVGMSLRDIMTYDFAAKVNAVPVTIVELPQIMQFYPIAFSAFAPATPLAILGLRDNENLFVNEKGEWLADTYIPAYIRRYPFIFAKNDAGNQLTLCIDNPDRCLIRRDSRLLFTPEGELTELTQNALEFCKSYQAAAEQTEAFSAALGKTDILIDRHAEIRIGEDKTITLSGFRQVDEQKFRALPDDTILDWHRQNWSGFVYAHLLSVNNWQKLFQLMDQRLGRKSA